MKRKMENKENNPIQEINVSDLRNLNYVSEVKKRGYSSHVYTFASRNQIELPEKPIKLRLSSLNSSSSSNEEHDELSQIFYDDVDERLRRAKEIANKIKRNYGISGCLLTEPIPIPIPIRKPELRRSPSLIF